MWGSAVKWGSTSNSLFRNGNAPPTSLENQTLPQARTPGLPPHAELAPLYTKKGLDPHRENLR
ncbi:MAG: hypothetical protein TREMPRED_005433, partial [Tremellales sp. Tagirdzhanova-0007]